VLWDIKYFNTIVGANSDPSQIMPGLDVGEAWGVRIRQSGSNFNKGSNTLSGSQDSAQHRLSPHDSFVMFAPCWAYSHVLKEMWLWRHSKERVSFFKANLPLLASLKIAYPDFHLLKQIYYQLFIDMAVPCITILFQNTQTGIYKKVTCLSFPRSPPASPPGSTHSLGPICTRRASRLENWSLSGNSHTPSFLSVLST